MLIFFSSGHSSSSPFSVGDPALQTPSHLKFHTGLSFALYCKGYLWHPSFPFLNSGMRGSSYIRQTPWKTAELSSFGRVSRRAGRARAWPVSSKGKCPIVRRFFWDPKPDLPACLPSPDCPAHAWALQAEQCCPLPFLLSQNFQIFGVPKIHLVFLNIMLKPFYPHFTDVLDVSVVSPTFLLFLIMKF